MKITGIYLKIDMQTHINLPAFSLQLLNKRLQLRLFPVNFEKYLRTTFWQNTSGWLPLKVSTELILRWDAPPRWGVLPQINSTEKSYPTKIKKDGKDDEMAISNYCNPNRNSMIALQLILKANLVCVFS